MEVNLPIHGTKKILPALLSIPAHATGIVIFVHGSGSSRFSPRNQFVAQELQKNGLATLLFDLLTSDEEIVDDRTSQLRFDIPFLTKRLIDATRWIIKHYPQLTIGYFGASTGAAAALEAAAQLGSMIHAIVSRGGRPDLAKKNLLKVTSPTLLIVGSLDTTVISLNRLALDQLLCTKQLSIVKGATHLFEEEGKMEDVTLLALQWFKKYL